jgi:hypothetical protein
MDDPFHSPVSFPVSFPRGRGFFPLPLFFSRTDDELKLTQKMRLNKKLRRYVKKDLYLRHLCKTYVIQIGRYFHDWRMEIISSEVATL